MLFRSEFKRRARQKDMLKLRNTNFGVQEYRTRTRKKKNYNSVILYSNKVLKNSIHLYNKFGFKEIKSEGNTPYKRSDIKMELILSDF